ncbi:MAG: PSD1 and planctomycete cytochrome C domain-containing protein, partial [Pirellulales bacterium]
CYHCHGPDAENRQADLRLDTREGALADLGGYAALVPGNSQQSELWTRMLSNDADERMPPADSGKQLKPEQIELVRRWIEQGADWSVHWSLEPPQRKPAQAIDKQPHDSHWGQNEIDPYILTRLTDEGLIPSPKADRRTLIRRLTLDLTGLPPSSQEIHAFLEDQQPGAYERMVERLLASPHYGERMALAWLDQARYADTNGYSIDGGRQMWLWRDWVIHAYNQNMPFDQFTIEQLAGDLLPQATVNQHVATGFNRNHMITHEGGTIPEENLTNYAVDRVKTTAEVFLGLTMGCAQCHNHKYDPLTQTDFYRFLAFFNTLGDRGLDGDRGKNSGPTIQARTVLGHEEMVPLQAKLAALRQQLQQPLDSQKAWEQEALDRLLARGKNLQLHPMKILKVSSPNRSSAADLQEDGTVLSLTQQARSPSIMMRAPSGKIVDGLRIEFLPHPSLPAGSLGHGKKPGFPGSFILTSFSVSADSLAAAQVDLYKTIAVDRVTASHSHPDYPAHGCLDDRDRYGWSPHPHNQSAQHITFTFQQPIDTTQMPFMTVLLVWGGGEFGGAGQLVAGQYRIYALTGTDDGTNLPVAIQTILQKQAAARTHMEQQQLQAYHASIAPELKNLRWEIANLDERLNALTQPHNVMVMNTASKPRQTHFLHRGQYDQPGELVHPGVPASLPELHEIPLKREANRLDLARWLVRPDHPLTARVAVNRIWQLLFGTGLVSTSADFGSQGSPPSHPLLLDWLALDFIESGWDVKHLVGKMVRSATYQQSSHVSPHSLQIDPNNRLLSHGPRFRLQGEFIRDASLKVSGLLVEQIGGPSVKPYQPPGLWKEISHFGSTPATAQAFVQEHGGKLYRRSMYTYWKRTVPPPSMVSFDAPNRELCTLQRQTTNTPLQALVLLNDPQFVEASRAFAERILRQGPRLGSHGSSLNINARIRFAFELATARNPTQKEVDILAQAYQQHLKQYQAQPARALAVVYTQVSCFGPNASHAVAKSHILLMPTQTVCGPGGGSLGRL